MKIQIQHTSGTVVTLQTEDTCSKNMLDTCQEELQNNSKLISELKDAVYKNRAHPAPYLTPPGEVVTPWEVVTHPYTRRVAMLGSCQSPLYWPSCHRITSRGVR